MWTILVFASGMLAGLWLGWEAGKIRAGQVMDEMREEGWRISPPRDGAA